MASQPIDPVGATYLSAWLPVGFRESPKGHWDVVGAKILFVHVHDDDGQDVDTVELRPIIEH